MQEYALNEAQARIEQLETELAQRASGGGLFGGGAPARPAAPTRRSAGHAPMPAAPQGGGFLAGAAQTAMGVAGGMPLANAIGGLFAADEAMAAEEELISQGGFDDADMDEDF
jgi:hypothetical protein